MAHIERSNVPELQNWIEQRDKTIASLKKLAKEIDRRNKNAKFEGVFYSASSIVGGVAAIGSAVSGGLPLAGLALYAGICGAAGTYEKGQMESSLEDMAEEQTKKQYNRITNTEKNWTDSLRHLSKLP